MAKPYGGSYISLGRGWWVPPHFQTSPRPSEDEIDPETGLAASGAVYPTLTIKVDPLSEPKYRVVAIEVSRLEGISGDHLRQIPLRRWADQAVKDAMMRGPDLPPGTQLPDRLRTELHHPEAQAIRPVLNGLNGLRLAEIAETYVEALEAGVPTARAIGERFNVSQVVARKWVAQCREEGFLTKTERRTKGGELTDMAKEVLKASRAAAGNLPGLETSMTLSVEEAFDDIFTTGSNLVTVTIGEEE